MAADAPEILLNVSISGLSYDWLQWNSSWGNAPGETPESSTARAKMLASKGTKRGFGYVHKFDLELAEARELHLILRSLAMVGESLTSEEMGDDRSNYAAFRRDTDRLDVMIRAYEGAVR